MTQVRLEISGVEEAHLETVIGIKNSLYVHHSLNGENSVHGQSNQLLTYFVYDFQQPMMV